MRQWEWMVIAHRAPELVKLQVLFPQLLVFCWPGPHILNTGPHRWISLIFCGVSWTFSQQKCQNTSHSFIYCILFFYFIIFYCILPNSILILLTITLQQINKYNVNLHDEHYNCKVFCFCYYIFKTSTVYSK